MAGLSVCGWPDASPSRQLAFCCAVMPVGQHRPVPQPPGPSPRWSSRERLPPLPTPLSCPAEDVAVAAQWSPGAAGAQAPQGPPHSLTHVCTCTSGTQGLCTTGLTPHPPGSRHGVLLGLQIRYHTVWG